MRISLGENKCHLVKKHEIVNQRDAEWYGKVSYASKSLYSVVRVVSRVFQWLNTLI